MELTILQYKEAIQSVLTEKEIETLVFLYEFPFSTASADELANKFGYKTLGGANIRIGQVGKSISIFFNTEPEMVYRKGYDRPAYHTLIAPYINGKWIMHENLKIALEKVGLVIKNDFSIDPIEEQTYYEGKVIVTYSNKYERNKKAREACIKHHGTSCYTCSINLETIYGEIAKGFIHVHHKLEISKIGKEYIIDPINDLVPLCPNCHSIVHLTKPAKNVDELKKVFIVIPTASL